MWHLPPEPPSSHALAPALRRLGLPLLEGVYPLGRRGTVWDWGLSFGESPGQVVLRTEPPHPGLGEGLERERAAMQLLGMLQVPVSRQYQAVPRGSLPWPAALCVLPEAEPGARLVRERPDEVYRALGMIAQVLGGAQLPWHGTRADQGRFLPTRPTWRGEWRARLGWIEGRIRCSGVDLGPATNQALARADAGLPALASVETFALVHGDLSPAVVHLEPTEERLVIHGITGWQGAMLADPLVEWAALLELPVAALGAVLRGYGAAELLLTTRSLQRLEVYVLTRQLERLALAPLDGHAAATQCQLGAALPQLLERDWVEARLRAALAGEEGPALLPEVPAHMVLRRRALEALRIPLDSERAQRVEAALALARLAEDAPAAEHALVARGLTLLDRVRGWPVEAEPVDSDWVDELLRLPSWGPDGGAEGLAWLGLDALARSGPVSDAVRRGLQTQVLARRTVSEGVPRHGRLRARAGLRGLAALWGLRRSGGQEPTVRLEDSFSQHLRLASRTLVAQLGPPPSLGERAARWAAQDDAVVIREAPLLVAADAIREEAPVNLGFLGF